MRGPRSIGRSALTPLGLLLGLSAIGVACGGGQTRGQTFETEWRDDGGATIAAVQRTFDDHLVPLGADFAVGVTDKGLLVGAKLDGTRPWAYRHALDGRPAIAGTVVVGIGDGELFALQGETGTLLWKRKAAGELRGVGDDGATTVISLAQTARTMSAVLAVTHRGQVIRQLEDAAPIGVPAVLDGYVFLPWQGHFVTVLDLTTGAELARIHLRTATSRAFTVGGALFFGEDGVTRFDDRIRLLGKGEASTVTLDGAALPGAPRWMTPGTDPLPLTALPSDHVRLLARPRAVGPIGIEGDRMVATFHRLALGLASPSSAIRWVHAHDAELLGGAAYHGGFALCDADGNVELLDAESGAVVARTSLGRAVTSCAVQIDGLRIASKSRVATLPEQLVEGLHLRGDDLIPAQQLLLGALLRSDDPLVLPTLRDLAVSDRVSAALAQAAQRALATREGEPPRSPPTGSR